MKLAKGLSFVITLLLFVSKAFAGILEHEQTCKDIGFKIKTEKFGECVLELNKREAANEAKVLPHRQQIPAISKTMGDGSYDDVTCQKYGFEPNTQSYAECRLKLDTAKNQIELQQAQFNAQMAAYQKQKEEIEDQQSRRFWAGVAGMGFGMMGGQSPGDSYRQSIGLPPTPPPVQNYTITMPNGRTSTCSYITSARAINCF